LSIAQHLDELPEAFGINTAPFIAAETSPAGLGGDVAPVIGAKHDGSDIELPGFQQLGCRLRPVVQPWPAQPRVLLNAPGDGNIVFCLDNAVHACPKAGAQHIAKNDHVVYLLHARQVAGLRHSLGGFVAGVGAGLLRQRWRRLQAVAGQCDTQTDCYSEKSPVHDRFNLQPPAQPLKQSRIGIAIRRHA
jgi:hypothetical protein